MNKLNSNTKFYWIMDNIRRKRTSLGVQQSISEVLIHVDSCWIVYVPILCHFQGYSIPDDNFKRYNSKTTELHLEGWSGEIFSRYSCNIWMRSSRNNGVLRVCALKNFLFRVDLFYFPWILFGLFRGNILKVLIIYFTLKILFYVINTWKEIRKGASFEIFNICG